MELTPIRIPGKRHRKGEQAVIFSARPRRKARQTVEEKKTKRAKPSYLERKLPFEIVERIFWASENVNFAKSSLRIGKLLSGLSTRRETFLEAFGPTWDVWFGCFRDRPGSIRPAVNSYYQWETDSSRFGGNPEFQSTLLRYSWVNISFILECWDIWIQRHARDRYFQHQWFWGGDEASSNMIPREQEDTGGYNNVNKPAREYFLHDYDAFCSRALEESLLRQFIGVGYLEVHPDIEIPEELLTGPWNEEATQKLFWLFRAGARLSDNQTWELTFEGYQRAMSGAIPNLRIIRILDMFGSFNTWPENIVWSAYKKLRFSTRHRTLVAGREHDYEDVVAMILGEVVMPGLPIPDGR